MTGLPEVRTELTREWPDSSGWWWKATAEAVVQVPGGGPVTLRASSEARTASEAIAEAQGEVYGMANDWQAER